MTLRRDSCVTVEGGLIRPLIDPRWTRFNGKHSATTLYTALLDAAIKRPNSLVVGTGYEPKKR